MESRTMVPKNLFAGQQWRKRQREKTYGHGERGGEGETYGESNVQTYITICKIDSQWEFAVFVSQETQIWALYQPREVGWGREMGGRFKRGYMYTYG